MPSSPDANCFEASAPERFFIPQSRKIACAVSSAFSPSGLSMFSLPSSIIGTPWLHIAACSSQLPEMFQCQNSASCRPVARIARQASIT